MLKVVANAENRSAHLGKLGLEGFVFLVNFLREFENGFVDIAVCEVGVGLDMDVGDLLDDALAQCVGVLGHRSFEGVEGQDEFLLRGVDVFR